MSDTLPAGFDADWYKGNYPDVVLTGIDPAEHYLRFGRLLGRKAGPDAIPPAPAPMPGPVPLSAPLSAPLAEPKTPDTAPGTAAGTAAGTPPTPRPSRPGPIIDRPAGFDAAQARPGRAGALPVAADGALTLAALARGPLASPACGLALDSYARLFRLPVPAGLAPATGEGQGEEQSGLERTGAAAFQQGETRIESLWLADAGTLRLRLAGAAAEGESLRAGWVLRAFQADAGAPDRLLPAGEGLVLPALGPVFWDLALVHPLMPVLVQMTDPAGVVQGILLIAFPSLVPGGLHAAEAKALQATANPVDTLWLLAERLVQELLGQPGWDPLSLGRLQVGLSGASGAEPLFAAPMRDWLAALFQLRPEPAESAAQGLTLGERALLAELTAGEAPPARAGLTLALPPDGLPTLSALVSRRLGASSEKGSEKAAVRRAAPYLVSDLSTLRPRWVVTPPADAPVAPDLPSLTLTGDASAVPLPVPVAILFRPQNPPHPTRLLLPEAPDSGQPAVERLGALEVILTARDALRTEDLLRSLVTMAEPRVRARLAGPDPAALRRALDAALGAGQWQEIAPATDLRLLARDGGARHLLTLDDRVVLYEPRVLAGLAALLEGAPDIASASCLLLGERAVKKHGVLQPATGGLFPSRVSFAAAPALGFYEPDTFQPLPHADYPVVANTLLLTLWRREILAALPLPAGPVTPEEADILLGLDALEAGYRHLCSSRLRAGFLGAYVRRDAIDPVGLAYRRPGLWERLLGRVTVLRELF